MVLGLDLISAVYKAGELFLVVPMLRETSGATCAARASGARDSCRVGTREVFGR